MKSLLFKTHLPDTVEDAFEALIDASIANAYFGACEPHRGPIDAEHARTLIFEMWGELVREGRALERACAVLGSVCDECRRKRE